MAKNTHSQEALTGTSDSYTEPELRDPYAMLRNRPVLEGVTNPREVDELSVGNNSTQSFENELTQSDSQTQGPQSPAPVDSPSPQGVTESSDAHLTGGSGPETAEQSAEAPQESTTRPPRKAAKAAKPAPPRKTQGRQAATADDDF